MTVSSSTNQATFLENGATVFPLPFRFFDDSDIQVYRVDPVTGATTPQNIGVDYALAGAGEPEVDGAALSVLTLTSPLTGANLFVERILPVEQTTDIVNQGSFFAETHEDVFDYLTMLTQQAESNSKGAIRVAIGDPEPNRLPPAPSRANLLMSFDSNGDPIAVAPVSGDASDLALNLANSSDPAKGATLVAFFGGGTVADLQDKASTTKGASILGWLRNALGAVGVNFGKYLGWQPVSVLDFMTDAQRDDVLNGTGALDLSVPLQAARDYIASGTLNRQLVFPAGVYAYSVSPNWALPDAQITAQGEVRLRYTGVGNAVIIDAGAGAETCFNLTMGRFIVEAPPTGGHGVYVRSIHESDLSFFVPTAGASSAGIRVDFAVLTTFRKPTVTSNVVSFYGAAPPQYGVYLNQRNPGETVSYCIFEGISCAGSPIGLHLEHTLGNLFLGGALQACTTRGMETSTTALRDKFIGLDFEANGVRDIVCLGRQMVFQDCDTTLSVFIAGSFNTIRGGNHETIEIDVSAIHPRLEGLLYRRNNTGSLINNSTTTNMRDLIRVDVGGITFTRHNSVPSKTTPLVGASPFTYTNTSGNDVTATVVGGTVSQLAISRPGVAGTNVGFTSGTVLLSPGDGLVITHSAAPALSILTR